MTFPLDPDRLNLKPYIIRVGQPGKVIELPAKLKSFDLIYQLIDTDMVEVLHLEGSMVMLLDEDGKGKGKPRNERATDLAHRANSGIAADDFIVGDVVVCMASHLS
jgi:hypothetical protein